MVDIANFPERVAEMMGVKEESDSKENDGIPSFCRLEIPLRSKQDLDRAADILIDLAHQLRLIARNHVEKQRSSLFYAWSETTSANRRMKGYTKSGS